MTHELFSADPWVGPADPARGFDTSNIPHFLPEDDSCTSAQQYSFGIIFNHENTANPTYAHARIHPYSLQPAHTSLRGTSMKITRFSKHRPTGRFRGSNTRIEMNGLAGCSDPTLDMTRTFRVNRRLAGRVVSDRVG